MKFTRLNVSKEPLRTSNFLHFYFTFMAIIIYGLNIYQFPFGIKGSVEKFYCFYPGQAMKKKIVNI